MIGHKIETQAKPIHYQPSVLKIVTLSFHWRMEMLLLSYKSEPRCFENQEHSDLLNLLLLSRLQNLVRIYVALAQLQYLKF